MMFPLKSILYLILLSSSIIGSIVYTPFIGILGYLCSYNINPVEHWWGGFLQTWGIRYSLFLAIATALGLIFHRPKLKFRGFFEFQKILLIVFLGLVWLSIPLGLGLNPEESNVVKMTKVTIILLMASYVIINLKRYEMMLWTLIIAGLYLGYEAFNAPGWMFSGGRLSAGIGGSDFSEGNFLGAHFAMLLPFLGVMFIKGGWKSKVLCLISGVFVTNSIILCRSRGIFLAILAGILLAIIFSIRRQRLKIFFGIGIAIVGAIFLTDQGFWRRMGGIETNATRIDASAQGRLLAWEAALSMASEYPFGVGEGNFKSYIGRYNPEMTGRDTHNTFLRCLAELGAQGALILLLLIANAFWILFQLKKKIRYLPNKVDFLWHIYALKIAIIIYLVAGIFITQTYIEEFYWLLMYPVFLKRSVENEIKVLHIPQMKGHQRSIFGRISNNTSKKFLLYLFIIPLILFGSQYSARSQVNPKFGSTYEQEALSDREIPGIIPAHPRLYLRIEAWKHGPNLVNLRTWAEEEPLRTYLKNKPLNPKLSEEWAFRYLLTGDEKLVPPIVQEMKKDEGYWMGRLTQLATLYDWLYNSPSFSAGDKKIVEDKMIRWARKAMEMGQQYSDIWSHYGYNPPLDIAAAGLALYGHNEEAKKYIAMAGGYIKRNLLQGWALNDGAWQGGWTYYGLGCFNLFRFIAMWSSATSEDLFEIIGKKQGDWVRNHLNYLIYTMYPDHTPVESCGFNYAPDQRGGTSALLLLTGAYKDLNGLKNLNWRNEWGWRLGIDQFMHLSPELKKKEIAQYDLPLTKLWGRKGLGYVQMRSGWEEGDTIIEFKCGDYFWSHQFQNQNSFSIYRKGRLAIQSGLYDAYYGNHMQFYYRPTISSNSILVVQPGEVSWIPPNMANKNRIPNTNGYTAEWGGQRPCYMIPEYGSAETCFTFDKYLYRRNHQHHFETGDITAFEATDRYSYVSGDATMAYNNPTFCYPGNKPKIDLYTRQLVFIDKKYLIIFDRVNSLSPEYEKRWLLHSIGEPQFIGKPLSVENPGHREVYKGGLVRTDNQGGTLYCQTLFPEDYLVRRVGGCATVTPARADSANKGNAILKTTVTGRYERIGSTIASDSARKEDWIIEFIDTDKYKVKGSVVGEDGIGSYKSLKEEIFISKSESIFIPRENWEGTPAKGDKFYFSVTSLSHRFWVNGRNYSPSLTKSIHIMKDGSQINPGNWRIEVFSKKKEKFNTFLHLLYPCDRDTANPPLAEGIVTSDVVMKGISIDNWMVFFGHKGYINQKIEYLIKSKHKTVNLLLDMKPEKPYILNIIKEGSEFSKQNVVASKEGSLFFTTIGPCRVKLEPL